jgi:NADH:ubiquinone oxidoreductase subunit F (NADH-binding)/NADH:ubiquinone oxidoreductase subunit E
MLVPALRDIQERHGYLPAKELELTALRLGLPLYHIQEVASFFPHFRLKPPPAVGTGVCQSMSCHLRGAAEALREAEAACQPEIAAGRLEIKGVSCLGRCDQAPVICLDRHGQAAIHNHFQGGFEPRRFAADLVSLIQRALRGETLPQPLTPDPSPLSTGERGVSRREKPLWQIDTYDSRHGDAPPPYEAVRRFLRTGGPKAVLDALKTSGLVGMGGAAARTAKKWDDVLKAAGQPKYVVCNGDESEPGTFKDRELLLHTPHLVIEGLLIAGLTVGARHGYIYIRHEYPEQIAVVRRTLDEARRQVPEAFRRCELDVFVSPGAYICGEESALLEVIEGKRAQPRNSPPDIRTNGLFDKPTVVNNVETLAWVPAIVLRDQGQWYRDLSLRFFSISGDVHRPGVFEVPMMTTLGELIERHAGGLPEKWKLHAVAASGPSGGFLPCRLDAERLRSTFQSRLPALAARSRTEADRLSAIVAKLLPAEQDRLDIRQLPLDVGLFRAFDLALGAGIVVYGKPPGQCRRLLPLALNCLEFFAKESCGKCVPCRLGCQQLVHLAGSLRTERPPLEAIGTEVRSLARVMEATSICGLGRAASNPLTSFLDYFGDELPASPPPPEHTP